MRMVMCMLMLLLLMRMLMQGNRLYILFVVYDIHNILNYFFFEINNLSYRTNPIIFTMIHTKLIQTKLINIALHIYLV